MNTLVNNPYYTEMLHKGRLIPFFTKDIRLICFISFYLGNENEESKFIRDNMWDVLEDNPDGDTCFIDQLWTDKVYENKRLSYGIWRRFKFYIQYNFPSVKLIRWNRYNRKTNKVKTYKKEMGK